MQGFIIIPEFAGIDIGFDIAAESVRSQAIDKNDYAKNESGHIK